MSCTIGISVSDVNKKSIQQSGLPLTSSSTLEPAQPSHSDPSLKCNPTSHTVSPHLGSQTPPHQPYRKHSSHAPHCIGVTRERFLCFFLRFQLVQSARFKKKCPWRSFFSALTIKTAYFPAHLQAKRENSTREERTRRKIWEALVQIFV